MRIEDFVSMLSDSEVKALLLELDRQPEKKKHLVSVRGYLVAPYRRKYGMRAVKARNKRHTWRNGH